MISVDFNGGWRFRVRGSAAEGVPVRLPHDAMLAEPRLPHLAGGESSGYFPGGFYIYEKRFAALHEWAGQTVLLAFGGVYQKAAVYLNGQLLMRHVSGFTPFAAEIGSALQPGENVLRVEADNTQIPNARWYTGSGIYRDVVLMTGPRGHFVPDGVRVTTLSCAPAVVAFDVEVQDAPGGPAGTMQLLLETPEGAPADFTVTKTSEYSENGIRRCRRTVQIQNARLWSEEQPALYRARLRLQNADGTADTAEVPFGVCRLAWDAADGLTVNGTPCKLRGACIHGDYGMLGACEYREAAFRRVRILKQAGFNAVRCAHNPPGRHLLDACDALGMYVMDEFSDVWRMAKNPYDYSLYFEREWQGDLAAMVRGAWAHPSVVLYSIGNEVADTTTLQGLGTEKMLAEAVRKLDPARPVTNCIHILTAASAPKDKPLKPPAVSADDVVDPRRAGKASPLVASKLMNFAVTLLPRLAQNVTPQKFARNLSAAMEPLDVTGINYGTHLTAALQDAAPGRLFVHSETYPSRIGQTWPVTRRCPNVIGDFLWTGWDYLGEAGIGVVQYGKTPRTVNKPYPCISGGTGCVNLAGEIEAQGDYVRAVYGRDAQPCIAVHPAQHAGEKVKTTPWRGTDAVASWSWEGCEGRTVQVDVCSSAFAVELYQDGRPLGRKPLLRSSASYRLTYRPGTLEARAYDAQGRCTGVCRLKTAGPETCLQAQAEKPRLQAGGRDIVYIRAAVTDAAGIVKTLHNLPVKVTAAGSGELLAVGSGAPVTAESSLGDCFTTYNGTMYAVVRSRDMPGTAEITLEAQGLPPQTVSLTVE